MKAYIPKVLLAGLFSFTVVSNVSAMQMQHSAATPADPTAAEAMSHPVENPWPTRRASSDAAFSGALIQCMNWW
jgi:hypothetical protein